MKNPLASFKKREIFIWVLSVVIITASFFIGEKKNYVSLAASLIGATALILNAKGDFIGQFFMIAFAILYAVVSYTEAYYGEMITYLGMTLPGGVISAVIWIKNTSDKSKREVKINRVSTRGHVIIFLLTAVVTGAFYFILGALNTNNLIVSTVSVATSFLASAYTFLRSPYFGLAYAANDVVLIVLWSMSVAEDLSYLPMLMCFVAFFINDVYSFINWLRMKKAQTESAPAAVSEESVSDEIEEVVEN